ncbi:FecR family protein [Flectobacillus roseus]|uniref:FecR family protein n=1 Tax=Flectobacillus roseus TaxID=502259 RepID=UPI00363F13E3
MQKKYQTIDDFLSDSSFKEWVYSGKKNEQWDEWISRNGNLVELLEQAKLYLMAMKVNEPVITENEVNEALSHTWEKIYQKENVWYLGIIKYYHQHKALSKIAALLLLGLSLVWIYNRHNTHESTLAYEELVEKQDDGLIEEANNTTKPQLVILSDGSSVLLQPNSKLSYPKFFDKDKRNVFLQGEAFFEISKNPQRPFYVYSNEVVTKVVGTSFRIKAYKDQSEVDIVVKTGKVLVSSNKELKSAGKTVLLLPNQSIRFQRENLIFEGIETAKKVNSPENLTAIESINFEFVDTPVKQIFESLEKAYLIQIEYPEDKLKECYLTTSLSDQPLAEKLKIICESLGSNTRYEMNGNQISIFSTGCN